MKMQFKKVEVGTLFSRPVFGISVIYRKASKETDRKAGTAEIVECLQDPSNAGRISTINRDYVVYTHDSNPITEQSRKNAAEYRRSIESNPNRLGRIAAQS